MKKYSFLTFIYVFIALFAMNGCSLKSQQQSSPNDYPSDQAVQNDDVVNNRAKVFNEEKLIHFINNVHAGKQDRIRVTSYTIEGDPIIQNLKYDGTKIERTEDTTRDKFGAQNMTTTACSEIGEETIEVHGDKYKQYYLSGCRNTSTPKLFILQVPLK